MANKFLNSGGESANLTNGTVDFYGASLGAINLGPSQAVKTNGSRQLISADLVISDVIGLQTALNNTIKNPYVGYLTATGYKTSGATPGVPQYLLDDGTTAGSIVVGGQSNIYYYNFSQTTSAGPTSGQIRWNSLESPTTTAIYISHITSVNPTDVDPFLALITDLSILYIQDRNDSTNFVKFKVNGTPTNTPNNYWTIPVIYQIAEGTGLTRFPNTHPIYMSVFFDTEEENTRIGILENKTYFQSRTDYTTSFLYPGTNGSMYTFTASGGNPSLGAVFPGWTSGFIGTSFTATTPFTLVQYRVGTTYLDDPSNTRTMNLFKNGLIFATFTFDKTVVSGILSIFNFPPNYDLTPGNYSLGLDLLADDDVFLSPTFTSLIPNFTSITGTIISGSSVTQGSIVVNTRSDTTVQADRFVAPLGGSSFLKADGSYDNNTYYKANDSPTFGVVSAFSVTGRIDTSNIISTDRSLLCKESATDIAGFTTSTGTDVTVGTTRKFGFQFSSVDNFQVTDYQYLTSKLVNAAATRQLFLYENNTIINTYTLNKATIDGIYSYCQVNAFLKKDIPYTFMIELLVGDKLLSNENTYSSPAYITNLGMKQIDPTQAVGSPFPVGGNLYVTRYTDITCNSVTINSGLSTEFLKADGTLDSTTYYKANDSPTFENVTVFSVSGRIDTSNIISADRSLLCKESVTDIAGITTETGVGITQGTTQRYGFQFSSVDNFQVTDFQYLTANLLNASATRQLFLYENNTIINTFTLNKATIDGLYSYCQVFVFLKKDTPYTFMIELLTSDKLSNSANTFSAPAYITNLGFKKSDPPIANTTPFGVGSNLYITRYTDITCNGVIINSGLSTDLIKADGTLDSTTIDKVVNQSRTTTNTSFIAPGNSGSGAMFSYTSGGSWARTGFSGVNFTATLPFTLDRLTVPVNRLLNGATTRTLTINKNGSLFNTYTFDKTNVDISGNPFYDWTGLLLTAGDYQVGLTLIAGDYAEYNPVYTSNYSFFTNIVKSDAVVGFGELNISYYIDYSVTADKFIGALEIVKGANEINIPQPQAAGNIIIGGAVTPNITTIENTFLGVNAGLAQTTGISNTFIGHNAGSTDTASFNSSALGQNAQITASNQVRLGNTSVTEVSTSGTYRGAGFAITGGPANTFMMADGTTLIQQLTQGYIIGNYVGLQYIHGSGINSNISNVASGALGSTSSVGSTYALTNNFTRQLCSALWTTTGLADGQAVGYGVGTGSSIVAVCSNFPFGLYYSLGIADTAYNANNCQNFWGLWNLTTQIPLNQTNQLSTRRNMICFGSDTNDPNICIYTAGVGTTVLQVDLGTSFPANRPSGSVSTNIFKLALWWDKTTVYYKAFNETLNVTVHGSFTPNAIDMPQTSISIYPQCVRVMGTPNSNGQAKLQVQRAGVFH